MSSINDNRLVISLRDENLLRDSRVIDEHKRIKKFIDRDPRARFRDLSKKDNNYFKNIYQKVLNTAAEEWVLLKNEFQYSKNMDFKCELCGQPIKFIFKIRNRFTKKELRIGSECAKYFGIGRKQDFSDLESKSRRIILLEKLNEYFPDIERIIDNWDSHVYDTKYILSDVEIRNYLDFGKKIKKLYEKYLNLSTSQSERDDIECELEDLFYDAEKEQKSISYLLSSFNNDIFAPRKEYLLGVDENNREEILKVFEDVQKVNRYVAWRINNIKLTEGILRLVRKDLEKFGFSNIKTITYNGRVGILLRYSKIRQIEFYCPHKVVAEAFCDEIFKDDSTFYSEEIDILSELKHGLIIIDYDMMALATEKIFEACSSKYRLYRFNNLDYSFDEIYVRNTKSNDYCLIKLSSFVKQFTSGLLFENLEFRDIDNYIIRNGKTMKKDDIDYFINSRR